MLRFEIKLTNKKAGSYAVGNLRLFHSQQLRAILTRRLAQDLFEDAIEVGQGLKPDFEGYFTYTKIRVKQQVF